MWQDHTIDEGTQSDRRPPRGRERENLLRRLWRDRRGVTAVEFAIVAPLVSFFLIGIVEFSVMMAVNNSLEAATNMSSRLGKTGYVDVDNSETQEQTIRDEVERRVGPLIDMANLVITHEVYNDFQSLNNPDIFEDKNADGDTTDAGEWTDVDGDGFRDGDDGLGASGNIVVYKVQYPWHIMTPGLSKFMGSDGVITLAAYSVVKNEPY